MRRRLARRPAWARAVSGAPALLSEYLVLLLTALYVARHIAVGAEIVAADTWRDILGSMMPLLIVAIGQTFVLIVAGIDLSATSILAMASVVGAAVMTGDGGLLAGVAAGSRSRRRCSPSSPSAARSAPSTAPAPPGSACRPSSSR